MRFLATAVTFLLFTGLACAAEVDGKWTGAMNTPNGNVTVNFTFQADGDKLNGSTMGPGGMEVKIADGRVNGDNISFSVTLDFGGTPLALNYKGVVAKDQINFTIEVFGMTLDLVVKKAS